MIDRLKKLTNNSGINVSIQNQSMTIGAQVGCTEFEGNIVFLFAEVVDAA